MFSWSREADDFEILWEILHLCWSINYNPGQKSLGQPETRHVFAKCSVFNALEGRVCAKWRPPSPWSMLLRKSALSAHWYNIERGRGKSKRGDFQRKSAGVPTLLSRIVALMLLRERWGVYEGSSSQVTQCNLPAARDAALTVLYCFGGLTYLCLLLEVQYDLD